MMTFILALLIASPLDQVEMVARWLGRGDLVGELQMLASRECGGEACGVHRNDVAYARSMYTKAVRVGWLNPKWCIWHREPGQLGVRGLFGTSAAYSLHYLPWSCIPPSWLDWPPFATWVTIRRFDGICEQYGACTRSGRHTYWVGRGNMKRRMQRG